MNSQKMIVLACVCLLALLQPVSGKINYPPNSELLVFESSPSTIQTSPLIPTENLTITCEFIGDIPVKKIFLGRICGTQNSVQLAVVTKKNGIELKDGAESNFLFEGEIERNGGEFKAIIQLHIIGVDASDACDYWCNAENGDVTDVWSYLLLTTSSVPSHDDFVHILTQQNARIAELEFELDQVASLGEQREEANGAVRNQLDEAVALLQEETHNFTAALEDLETSSIAERLQLSSGIASLQSVQDDLSVLVQSHDAYISQLTLDPINHAESGLVQCGRSSDWVQVGQFKMATFRVNFTQPYSDLPQVLLSVTHLDRPQLSLLGTQYYAELLDVNLDHFMVECKTLKRTEWRIVEMWVNWLSVKA